MRDLNKVTGDEALDFWIDIFEPSARIIADPLVDDYRKGKLEGMSMASFISKLVKNHKTEMWEVLSAFQGVSVEQCKSTTNVVMIPRMIMDIVKMEGFRDFFSSLLPTQVQSGDATESTEVEEELKSFPDTSKQSARKKQSSRVSKST